MCLNDRMVKELHDFFSQMQLLMIKFLIKAPHDLFFHVYFEKFDGYDAFFEYICGNFLKLLGKYLIILY